jgi:hypothetical protein
MSHQRLAEASLCITYSTGTTHIKRIVSALKELKIYQKGLKYLEDRLIVSSTTLVPR